MIFYDQDRGIEKCSFVYFLLTSVLTRHQSCGLDKSTMPEKLRKDLPLLKVLGDHDVPYAKAFMSPSYCKTAYVNPFRFICISHSVSPIGTDRLFVYHDLLFIDERLRRFV